MTSQEFSDRLHILLADYTQWDPEEIEQEEVIVLALHGEYCSHFVQLSLPELYDQEEKIGWEQLSAGLCDELDSVEKVQRRQRSLNYPYYLDDAEKELFERLRNRRAQLAKERHVPPYVIFGNRALYEMCIERPSDAEQMKKLYGVGEMNFSRYGEEFLSLIQNFGEENDIRDDPVPEAM